LNEKSFPNPRQSPFLTYLPYQFDAIDLIFSPHSISELLNRKAFVRLSPDGDAETNPRVDRSARRGSTVTGVNGFYIQSSTEGRLFVIKGMVTNKFSGPRSPIPITGTLKDDHGRVLQEKTVYAGITLTEDQIKDKSLLEMDRALVNNTYLGDVGPGRRFRLLPFLEVHRRICSKRTDG
jgi:hypothetical protein